jgi:hypothetical protein
MVSPAMLAANEARNYARRYEDSQQVLLNYTSGLPLLSPLPPVARRSGDEGTLPSYNTEQYLSQYDTVAPASNITPTPPGTDIERHHFAATADDAEEGLTGPVQETRASAPASRTGNASEKFVQVLSAPFKWLHNLYSTKIKAWVKECPSEDAYNYDFKYANCKSFNLSERFRSTKVVVL